MEDCVEEGELFFLEETVGLENVGLGRDATPPVKILGAGRFGVSAMLAGSEGFTVISGRCLVGSVAGVVKGVGGAVTGEGGGKMGGGDRDGGTAGVGSGEMGVVGGVGTWETSGD